LNFFHFFIWREKPLFYKDFKGKSLGEKTSFLSEKVILNFAKLFHFFKKGAILYFELLYAKEGAIYVNHPCREALLLGIRGRKRDPLERTGSPLAAKRKS
jgi:hypothetical protein